MPRPKSCQAVLSGPCSAGPFCRATYTGFCTQTIRPTSPLCFLNHAAHPDAPFFYFSGRRLSHTFATRPAFAMFDVNWQGLLLPLAYLVVLVGTFLTFSRVYRRRKARVYCLENRCDLPRTLTISPPPSRERQPRTLVRSAPATQHLPVASAHGARGGVREGAQGAG